MQDTTTTAPATKPPAQVAGVVGIAATPITMNEPAPELARAIDWPKVAGLPPFQMFAAERMRNTTGKDSFDHALEFVRARGAGQDVLDEYEAWHAAKGYWPSETPYGEAK